MKRKIGANGTVNRTVRKDECCWVFKNSCDSVAAWLQGRIVQIKWALKFSFSSYNQIIYVQYFLWFILMMLLVSQIVWHQMIINRLESVWKGVITAEFEVYFLWYTLSKATYHSGQDSQFLDWDVILWVIS
jgi:hypothetical protein